MMVLDATRMGGLSLSNAPTIPPAFQVTFRGLSVDQAVDDTKLGVDKVVFGGHGMGSRLTTEAPFAVVVAVDKDNPLAGSGRLFESLSSGLNTHDGKVRLHKWEVTGLPEIK
jgi:predicted TIM-barrel enzyme